MNSTVTRTTVQRHNSNVCRAIVFRQVDVAMASEIAWTFPMRPIARHVIQTAPIVCQKNSRATIHFAWNQITSVTVVSIQKINVIDTLLEGISFAL